MQLSTEISYGSKLDKGRSVQLLDQAKGRVVSDNDQDPATLEHSGTVNNGQMHIVQQTPGSSRRRTVFHVARPERVPDHSLVASRMSAPLSRRDTLADEAFDTFDNTGTSMTATRLDAAEAKAVASDQSQSAAVSQASNGADRGVRKDYDAELVGVELYDSKARQRLMNGAWVDDHALSTILHAFNPDPAALYVVDSQVIDLNHTHGTKWTTLRGLRGQQQLAFSINLDNTHWVLGWVDCQEATCTIYDSLFSNQRVTQKILRALQSFVRFFDLCEKEPVLRQDPDNTLRQNNGIDCGMCLALHYLWLTHRLPLANVHVSEWRYMLAHLFGGREPEVAFQSRSCNIRLPAVQIEMGDLTRSLTEARHQHLEQYRMLFDIARRQICCLEETVRNAVDADYLKKWLEGAPSNSRMTTSGLSQAVTMNLAKVRAMWADQSRAKEAKLRIGWLLRACSDTFAEWRGLYEALRGHADDCISSMKDLHMSAFFASDFDTPDVAIQPEPPAVSRVKSSARSPPQWMEAVDKQRATREGGDQPTAKAQEEGPANTLGRKRERSVGAKSSNDGRSSKSRKLGKGKAVASEVSNSPCCPLWLLTLTMEGLPKDR